MRFITPYNLKRVAAHGRHALVYFILAFSFFTTAPLLNQSAQAQLLCPMRAIEQITEDSDDPSERPSINADGTRIAFDSQANINGTNPSGTRQIYIYDTITRSFTQVTDDASAGSANASISADGNLVAFNSGANINGGNPDGNAEIFLFNALTGTTMQITDETEGNSFVPNISADGSRIGFHSTAPINVPNPGNNPQVYLFDIASGVFTKITDEAAGQSLRPSLNEDGTYVAFESTANINGGNPGGGFEIYLFNADTAVITQITDEDGASRVPSIDSSGMLIAFFTTADINGGNPEGNEEIYLFNRATFQFTQITDETSGDSANPSLSANGERVAFHSNANINGGNPEGNIDIFITEIANGSTTQITSESGGDSDDPALNAEGSRIAFDSDANIGGGNPDGLEEIYLAFCFDDSFVRPIPTLSEWGLIAMAGVLGIIGLIAIRRTKATAY